MEKEAKLVEGGIGGNPDMMKILLSQQSKYPKVSIDNWRQMLVMKKEAGVVEGEIGGHLGASKGVVEGEIGGDPAAIRKQRLKDLSYLPERHPARVRRMNNHWSSRIGEVSFFDFSVGVVKTLAMLSLITIPLDPIERQKVCNAYRSMRVQMERLSVLYRDKLPKIYYLPKIYKLVPAIGIGLVAWSKSKKLFSPA